MKTNASYPDLHDESAIETNFFLLIVKLMHICGIHDFGLKDLTYPTAKRLKRQLSGAINYCKFYEERANMYSELTMQRNELLEGMSEVSAENEVLLKQREESKLIADNKSKEIEEIEKECKEVRLIYLFREIEIMNKNLIIEQNTLSFVTCVTFVI